MKIDREVSSQDTALPELITQIRSAVQRRWLTLLAVTLVIFGIGVGITYSLTPQYTSFARIQIDPSRDPMAASKQGGDQPLSPEAIETEVSIVSSPESADHVVHRLHLDQLADYSKGLAPGLSPAERASAVAGSVLKHLTVSRDKLTYILKIEYTAKDPVLAANIANAFADEYLSSKIGQSSGLAENQSTWLRQQLDQLGGEVHAAEAKVSQYRAEAGIVGSKGGGDHGVTIIDQQIGPLAMSLAQAKSDAAAANSTLDAAQRQLSQGGRDSVNAVLDSPVIADLRRERAEIIRNMDDSAAHYGEKHPEMIKAREQLSSIDAQIKEQTDHVIASLYSAAKAANARVVALQQNMDQLSSRLVSNDHAAVQADSLQEEADTKRNQYQKLAAMSLDAAQKAHNSIATATIVDRARPSLTPSFPIVPLFLALSLIVGLAAGGATVATQELMVTGILSKTDVENVLGLQLLAAIPQLKRNEHPADQIMDRPTSLFSESFRIARASILGVKRSGQNVQVIAFTSALPSEGKSTTALAFARALAVNGSKTLLMECDVRRAILQTHVRGKMPEYGTIEVLRGEATLAQATFPGEVEGLSQIFTLKPHFDSSNLFGDERMLRVLAEARQEYDHIVLDLPPLVGLADGRYIAALADTTALIVRWARTPANAASSSVEWLRSDGANVAGVILTMVDPGAEASGAYYYSKSYHGYYDKS